MCEPRRRPCAASRSPRRVYSPSTTAVILRANGAGLAHRKPYLLTRWYHFSFPKPSARPVRRVVARQLAAGLVDTAAWALDSDIICRAEIAHARRAQRRHPKAICPRFVLAYFLPADHRQSRWSMEPIGASAVRSALRRSAPVLSASCASVRTLRT